MTTTITIKDKAVNRAFQDVSGLTGGSGDGAVFDVTKTDGVYTAVLDTLAASAGHGYVAGDTITIPGAQLGGVTPVNDLILTVATVGAAGKIATFGSVGTGRVGDGTIDVLVDVTGTTGIDTYVFNGTAAQHTIAKTSEGITVGSLLSTNVEFKLANHERIVFSDKAIAFDASGNAGEVYSILAAALGVSDVTKAYEGIGISLADAGWSKVKMAEALLGTDVYKTDAGGVSNETFIKQVYKNVFGTNATLSQVQSYTTWMENSRLSQAEVLVLASDLPAFETSIGLVGLATTGIEYTPVV
jgi:hypothetical protein